MDAQKDVPARTLIFSGDLGRTGAPILREPAVRDPGGLRLRGVDLRRPHPRTRSPSRSISSPTPSRISSPQNGVLLVPSFAIGRTQEVVWALQHLLDSGRIPPVKPLSGFADGVEGVDDLPRAYGLLRRRNAGLAQQGRRSDRLPECEGDAARRAVGGDRTSAPAVRPRCVKRHAHRRPRAQPPSDADRRYEGDDPVRRLPGRGNARCQLQAGVKTARVDGQEYQVRCGCDRSAASPPTRTNRRSSPG